MKRGPVIESPPNETLPLSVTANLLDLLEQPILVSDRTGRILLANLRGKQRLASYGFAFDANFNLFSDLLHVNPKVIVGSNRERGATGSIRSSTVAPEALSREFSGFPKRTGSSSGLRTRRNRRARISRQHKTYRAGIAAGARDHLPESTRRLLAFARGKPSEDGIPGFRRA